MFKRCGKITGSKVLFLPPAALRCHSGGQCTFHLSWLAALSRSMTVSSEKHLQNHRERTEAWDHWGRAGCDRGISTQSADTVSNIDWSHPRYHHIPGEACWGHQLRLADVPLLCIKIISLLLYFQTSFQKFGGKLHQTENARLIANASSFYRYFKLGREERGTN